MPAQIIAIRPIRGTSIKLRTDLSATLLLSDPASYDGGVLIIDGAFGGQAVKLARRPPRQLFLGPVDDPR